MKLSEVARIMGGETRLPSGGRASRPGGEADLEIADVSYDSRSVSPGTLFFCIPGAHFDGHQFGRRAVEAGAIALVCERLLELPVPQVLVADSLAAMNRLAAPFFGDPSSRMDIVGVSGTNGKTTTAYMLERIFQAAGHKTGLIGTVETRIGDEAPLPGERTTPESIDLQRLLAKMVQAGVTRAAMEATSIGLERGRVEGTRFAAVVFTNLSHDHLDYHGDVESYYQAKKRLFSRVFSVKAAINADDDHGRRLLAETELETLTFGTGEGCQLKAEELDIGFSGSTFLVKGAGIERKMRIALPGRFNVMNALAAAAGALLAGIDQRHIAGGLEALGAVRGRMERVDAGQDFSVLVDYAHTPAALEQLILAVREIVSAGRLILVFGCGGDRDRDKRAVMGATAGGADLAIATSDNPRSEDPVEILNEVEVGLRQKPPREGYMVIEDRRSAIETAIAGAGPGDAVIVAGKGHETGQYVRGLKHDFDDRLVALDALEARLGR